MSAPFPVRNDLPKNMLIADCLEKIYYRFEKSSEAPDTDSEDYLVRLEYCNAAISKWEHEQGIEWKELFGEMTGTLTAGVFSFGTSDNYPNFRNPAGSLWIGDDKYEYVRPERVEKEVEMNDLKKIYTITGSRGSFSLNVYPAITDNFTLNYRKYATTFTTGVETSPEIQMSDPDFIIYDVLSNLYLEDDNNTQASVMSQVASAKMDAMKLANETYPFNNQSKVPDDEFSGFGN